MPAVVLPAVSIVCTDSVPVPFDSVTLLADQVWLLVLTVAATHVVPPFALIWIVSPVPSVPV